MNESNKNKKLFKISLKGNPNKDQDLIKSITLIKKFKKVLHKKNAKKKFLGKKRKVLSIAKSADININSLYMNFNTQKCVICLENINLNERHFLHCGHFFHCSCIDKWIEMGKDKCPMCRQKIECNNRASHNSISLEENENNNVVQNIHDYSVIYLILNCIIKYFLFTISNYLAISSIQTLRDIFPGILRFILINSFLLKIFL